MSREVPLPRKSWIGSYEFEMKIVPADDPVLEGQNGMTVAEDKKKGVYFSDSLGALHLLEIVIHELTHAIVWVHDLTAENDDEEAEDMVTIPEETLATKFGLAWSAFLVDNPRFQRWLTYILNRIRKERTDGA